MKKIIAIIFCFCVALSAIPATQVLGETIIPKENVVGIYQETGTTHYYMVFTYNGNRSAASISKSELKKYYMVKELDIDYLIILQQLKTKQRIIIKYYGQ